MNVNDIWTKTINWLRSRSLVRDPEYQPQIDDQGLINEDIDPVDPAANNQAVQGSNIVIKTVQPRSRTESLEKLQAGFDKLIDKLQGINDHLNRQISQNEELMKKIEQLPELLGTFPTILESQRQVIEQLLEHLKGAAVKNEQFIEAIEKIPAETARQTDALVNIDHQLAAAADVDVQMTEGFNKFNETLNNLNKSALTQADSIIQMSKTFATSDRYFKHIITKQNKRFMWIFIAAISVCAAVVLVLTGIIIYLKQ